ncbi:MAG: hypothetical protein AAF982_04270 [Pseudomonadota bacterium]
MNFLSLLTVTGLTVCALADPGFTEGSEAYPLFNADNTTSHEVTATPARYKGRDGLKITVDPDHGSLPEGGCDNCTYLAIDGIDFGDGMIEVEVAGRPGPDASRANRGFVGIVFRADTDAESFEGVYLRPANATAPQQIRRNHTVQYFSFPDYPWMRLREESPGHYESFAPVVTGAWTRLRIEVKGHGMKLFTDGSAIPALVVNDLKHGADKRGTIGLFTEPETEAYFRNLVVTHADRNV